VSANSAIDPTGKGSTVEAKGPIAGFRTALGGNRDGEGRIPVLEVCESLVPGLVLADWLDRYVDDLLWNTLGCEGPEICQACATLADGLSSAADALRSSDRCEIDLAEQQLRFAVSLLMDEKLGGTDHSS
jgi:hypothetical protein